MFNNHTMTLITDSNMLQMEAKNIDFVTVATITTGEYLEGPNIFYSGILVPPTDLLMRWAEGDPSAISFEYPNYLMTKDCDEMIVAIIAAMTKKNIILYIPHDEYVVYGDILLRHLWIVYGITCNTPTSQFSLDPTKLPMILSKFYMMDIIDKNTYIDTYPWQYALPDFVINKLAIETGPINGQYMTFDQYRDYFNKFIVDKSTSLSGNKILMTRALVK